MSTKRLAKKVLADIKKAGETRKELIGQVGQILFVNPAIFKEALSDIFGKSLSEKALTNIWAAWNIWLKSQANNIKDKNRLEELKHALINLKPRPGEVAYIIGAYETIKKNKAGTGNSKLGKIITTEGINVNDNRLSLVGGQGDKFGSQLGHEEAGRGVAASAAKVLKSKGTVSRSKVKGKEKIDQIIDKYLNTLEVTVTHEQMFDAKGGLKKKYIPILTWQKTVDNQEMKEVEEQALISLQKELQYEIENNLTGSTPLGTLVGQVVLSGVAPETKRKNTRITGKKKATFREKSKNTEKAKTERKRKIKAVRDGPPPASLGVLKQKSKQQGFNQFQLLAAINRKLPQTVEKNMKAPRLESQTGRFAKSVELETVTRTRKGYLSFGYSYEKDPYQVFEVGKGAAPWATPLRDPRQLIDRSIREAAAELAIGRFYTRRL